MSDLNFVIFKLGRSGSSALSLALDQAEGCCCISEILNDLSDKEVDPSYFQRFIDERIRSITEASKIGFTLNPFKSPKIEHGFWRFPKSHTKIVFNLTISIIFAGNDNKRNEFEMCDLLLPIN